MIVKTFLIDNIFTNSTTTKKVFFNDFNIHVIEVRNSRQRKGNITTNYREQQNTNKYLKLNSLFKAKKTRES